LDEVSEKVQISFDATYRPAFAFSGAIYGDSGQDHPKAGYSVMFGLALKL
jgi:hypothetical protein